MRLLRAPNHLIGPLGSGKTRFIQHLADARPNAVFLGLERASDSANHLARVQADLALKSRVEAALDRLARDGAGVSDPLVAPPVFPETTPSPSSILKARRFTSNMNLRTTRSIICLDWSAWPNRRNGARAPSTLVADMVEHGLDQIAKSALISELRRRGPKARPIFFTTRSSTILDLDAVGPDEAIILCPANHGPPSSVAPYPGSPGCEAVATCLASSDVRARTAGVRTSRPEAA